MRLSIISLIILVVHVLSATLFQYLRIGEIAPHFMIMIIVSFALLRGSTEGSIIGMGAGLLNDVVFGMFLGPTIINYTIIGYICGKFNRNFYRENFIIPFFCTLFSTLFFSIVTMSGFLLRGKSNVIFFLKTIVIPEMIYTITLSLIVYQFAYLINDKIEHHERKTRNIF